jgi:hypothetical protein
MTITTKEIARITTHRDLGGSRYVEKYQEMNQIK